MLNSDEFVVELWRSSIDHFIAYIWDGTPTKAAARFLAPVDPELGNSPDSVEWQFPKVRKREKKKNIPSTARVGEVTPPPINAERKAIKLVESAAAKKANQQVYCRRVCPVGTLRNSG